MAAPGRGDQVVILPLKHEGVFMAKGRENALCTKNLVPGEAVYNEELISVQNDDGTEVQYRVWNPSTSNLAAAILCGVDNIWIKPGSHVLYLGAASGITVSHVSDIVGPEGLVYAVEKDHTSGKDLIINTKKRMNVIPILECAINKIKYNMLCGMVDVIISDTVHPYMARFVSLNAVHYLKVGGHYLITLKTEASAFPACIEKVLREQFNPMEQVTLEQFKKERVCYVGGFRMPEMESTPRVT